MEAPLRTFAGIWSAGVAFFAAHGGGDQRWEKVNLAPSSTLKFDQFLLTQAPMT
jgi:hypothetical protein